MWKRREAEQGGERHLIVSDGENGGELIYPSVHYRVSIDRAGVARESIVDILDTFPAKEHIGHALREAYDRAGRLNGTLRSLRLDAAWHAVIQRVVDEERAFPPPSSPYDSLSACPNHDVDAEVPYGSSAS